MKKMFRDDKVCETAGALWRRRQFRAWMTLCLLAVALPSPVEAGVVERIEELNPHLRNDAVPNLDLKLMAIGDSSYTFFRGTADLYADWFSRRCSDWSEPERPRVRLHGDVHPGNFGTYEARGADGRLALVFDLVDMDETFAGPLEYDLMRAIVALRFAAAERRLGMDADAWSCVCEALAGAYRQGIDAPDRVRELVSENKIVRKAIKKARQASAESYWNEYVTFEPAPRFLSHREGKNGVRDVMAPLDAAERETVVEAFAKAGKRNAASDWRRLFGGDGIETRVCDIVRWVRCGSSGSQGLRKYLLLAKPSLPGAPSWAIFQLKEEPRPAAVRAGLVLGLGGRARAYEVACCFVSLQASPRVGTGWARVEESGFLVKPKVHNAKEPKTKDFKKADDVVAFARVMGGLLGAAHARSSLSPSDRAAFRRAAFDPTLSFKLQHRSRAAYEHLSWLYRDFVREPSYLTAANRAKTWINSVSR